ncbi:MAG TPA: phage head closure protein [Candidatus Angelobacter sp.]|nr:phage head closure protein [Candidatus Angelobacter sp.]
MNPARLSTGKRHAPIGSKTSQVQLQRRTGPPDAYGQPSTTFTTYATVFARVRSLGGSELFKSQEMAPEVTHEISLDWFQGLTDSITQLDCVLLSDGTILDIAYPNYSENHLDDIVLLCKQRLGSTAK